MKAFFASIFALFLFVGCDTADMVGPKAEEEVTVKPLSASVEKGLVSASGEISEAIFTFTFTVTGGSEITHLEMSADTSADAPIRYQIDPSVDAEVVHTPALSTTALTRDRGKFDVAIIRPGQTETVDLRVFVEASEDGFYHLTLPSIMLGDEEHALALESDAVFLDRSDVAWTVVNGRELESRVIRVGKYLDDGKLDEARAAAQVAESFGHTFIDEVRGSTELSDRESVYLSLLSKLLDLEELIEEKDIHTAVERVDQIVSTLRTLVSSVSKG